MRFITGNILFTDRPFQGQGVSVYVGTGQPRYRRPRIVSGRLTPVRTALATTKTARIHSEAATAGTVEVTATLPAELYDNQAAAIDVRRYRDDVENLVVDPVVLSLDSSGDEAEIMEGRAIELATEQTTGGTAKLLWRYEHRRGTPAQFRVERLSGPTTPDDVTVTYRVDGPGIYEATFSSLTAGTYTFAVSIETTGASTTLTLLSPVTVVVSTSGPNAPTGLAVEVR